MSNISVDSGSVEETQDVKKGNSYGSEIVETSSGETILLEEVSENTENTSAEQTAPVPTALEDEVTIEPSL
ncbi:hypothetical protein DCAR_0522370 [Daucus carota subsp. sativus]|uniref:Uncharacterized protein n=1 Tax=Daucus carota subsp. sativus TaxID=79200 RepID=A0A162A6X3_DAUCS|nr:hypothetical protein DCAR_0522370 [Daucus carota subsp. sativus]